MRHRRSSGNLAAVHIWSVASNSKTNAFTHRLNTEAGHALLVPLACSVFRALGVSISLFDGQFWWPIHSAPSLIPFEGEYGVEAKRWRYNERCFAEVTRQKKPILAELGGHRDLFVPVVMRREVTGILVVGSFATARPTSTDVLARWRTMTGHQGHPGDPAFLSFLRASLDVLVLEGGKVRSLERLVVCLAKLLASVGRADALANEADALRRELEPARFVEHVWEAARMMTDERWAHGHYSAAFAYDLRRLGLARAPDQVLVGLSRTPASGSDPVADLVVRDALQRHAVDVARQAGDAIAGRVGDHGVMILSAARGSAPAKKRRLLDLGKTIATVAERQFGLAMHVGAALGSGAESLSRVYQDALGAAESALATGKKLIVASTGTTRPSRPLRKLREELERGVEVDPGSFPAKLDRYLEAVALHSGYRMDSAHVALELFLEHVGGTLVRAGALDPRSFDTLRDGLDRATARAETVNDLFAAYRRAADDMTATVRNPVAARQDRSLRRALEYIDQHYAEPLTLTTVARIAGFEATYFSRLFRRHAGLPFERHLFHLRIERAKHLLTGTDLSATRVAELSGLRTPQHLCHAFQRAFGMTPLEYRASESPHWAKSASEKRKRVQKKTHP